MYNKILGTAALVVSLIFAQGAFANSSDCGEKLQKTVASLNLTADQKTKIQPILDQLKTAVKQNASQMNDIDKQIDQQVTSTSMDENTVNGLIDKKTNLIGNIIKAKVSAKNQIIAILTDDQKAKLQAKMKTVKDKMAAKWAKCHDAD